MKRHGESSSGGSWRDDDKRARVGTEPAGGQSDLDKKRAAWRAKKAALSQASAQANDDSARPKARGLFGDDDAPTGLAPAYQKQQVDVAQDFYEKSQRLQEERALAKKAAAEAEDALDAFMNAEVQPEVNANQEQERKRAEAEKAALLEQVKSGKVSVSVQGLDEGAEVEETPDLEIQVPEHKVKLIIGPGGERIKRIQQKSRTRIQVKKDDAELERAFGLGTKLKLPGKIAMMAAQQGGEVKMATIMIFGDSQRVQQAKEMLMEAVENKDQKQKQRQKEYDKKREEKTRNRQIYYLRHTKDYEILGVPVGTPKPELKAAYRKLALKWHPDRHPNDVEEAKAKFQAIHNAYESLMSTDEEATVQQIA